MILTRSILHGYILTSLVFWYFHGNIHISQQRICHWALWLIGNIWQCSDPQTDLQDLQRKWGCPMSGQDTHGLNKAKSWSSMGWVGTTPWLLETSQRGWSSRCSRDGYMNIKHESLVGGFKQFMLIWYNLGINTMSMVGGFKHFLFIFHFIYGIIHDNPSHWRTHIFFKMVIAPATRSCSGLDCIGSRICTYGNKELPELVSWCFMIFQACDSMNVNI